jgi:hypothetical protein
VADAVSVLVKALAGGSLVVLFALLSESLAPNRGLVMTACRAAGTQQRSADN